MELDIRPGLDTLDEMDFDVACSCHSHRGNCEDPAFVYALVKCQECAESIHYYYCKRHFAILLTSFLTHDFRIPCEGKCYYISHVGIK